VRLELPPPVALRAPTSPRSVLARSALRADGGGHAGPRRFIEGRSGAADSKELSLLPSLEPQARSEIACAVLHD